VSAYLNLLRTRPDFARLWLAQVISLLGDWFNTIVLSALVAEYSGGSGLAVSAFLLARFLPPLIVGPFAGVLVDRFDRKRLLIWSDIGRTIIMFVMLLALQPDRLWLIYVLTILQWSVSAVFDPGRNAILPSLLPRDELVVGNTLSSVTWSVMLAVGAIAGGLVARAFGTQTAIIIDAITFAVSAVLIMQIRLHPEYTSEADETRREAGAKSDQGFIDGLRYAIRFPSTLAILLVKTAQSLGNVDALMVIYATTLFMIDGDTTTPLSIMYAAFGIGAVVGPLLLNRFNDGQVRTMRRLIIVGFVLLTLGWFLMGGANTLVLVSLALIVRAMGGSVNWTYSSVIIQKSVPNNFLGRMFSLDMAGYQLASAISITATGALVDALGAENVRQVSYLLGAISLIPLALWVLALPRLERAEANVAPAAGD
jgi:MFS family permease